MKRKAPPSIWRNWVQFLAFGFGVATFPLPKTLACLLAVAIYCLLSKLPHSIYALLLLVLFVIGVWLCEVTIKQLKVKSHRGIVCDQIVGMLIGLFAIPVTWKWLLFTFVLFRIFSICKPWPIAWLRDNVQGGLHLMLDDVIAAIYTLIIIQVLLWAMGL